MRAVPLVLLAAVGLAACAGSGPVAEAPVEERFGYRLGGDETRETAQIAPPVEGTRYLLFPAVIDGVVVRAAGRPAPGDAVAVEVLIEGAFPDACAQLAEVEQSRAGHFVTAALVMRQPRERVCAAVVRPFRYYLVLEDAFEAGNYTLTLNGATHPFQVLPLPVAEGGDVE